MRRDRQLSVMLAVAATLLLACSPTSARTASLEDLPEDAAISAVEISPDFASDGTLLLGTESHGLFRSQDGGETWENVLATSAPDAQEAEPTSAITDIAFSPGFAEDGEAHVGTETGLYHSSDRGDTWTPIEDTPFRYVFRIAVPPDYSSSGTLFVTARENELLWRTQDGGLSWTNLGGLRDVNFLNDGSMVARTGYEARRSTDWGDSWSTIFESQSETLDALTLSPNFMDDGVAFWADPTGKSDMRRLKLHEGERQGLGFKAAASDCHHNRGFGVGCIVRPALSPDFAKDGTVFAASITGPGKGNLMKSENGGATWEPLSFPTSDLIVDIAVSPAFSEDQTVLAVTGSQVFVSKDGGDTWRGG